MGGVGSMPKRYKGLHKHVHIAVQWHVTGALRVSLSPLPEEAGACLQRSIVSAQSAIPSSAKLVLLVAKNVPRVFLGISDFQLGVLSCIRVYRNYCPFAF